MIFREFVCSLVICLRSSLKYSNIHAQFFDCFVYCHFNFFSFPHAKKKQTNNNIHENPYKKFRAYSHKKMNRIVSV